MLKHSSKGDSLVCSRFRTQGQRTETEQLYECPLLPQHKEHMNTEWRTAGHKGSCWEKFTGENNHHLRETQLWRCRTVDNFRGKKHCPGVGVGRSRGWKRKGPREPGKPEPTEKENLGREGTEHKMNTKGLQSPTQWPPGTSRKQPLLGWAIVRGPQSQLHSHRLPPRGDAAWPQPSRCWSCKFIKEFNFVLSKQPFTNEHCPLLPTPESQS